MYEHASFWMSPPPPALLIAAAAIVGGYVTSIANSFERRRLRDKLARERESKADYRRQKREALDTVVAQRVINNDTWAELNAARRGAEIAGMEAEAAREALADERQVVREQAGNLARMRAALNRIAIGGGTGPAREIAAYALAIETDRAA